jgi:Pyridoxamine 5'-phosphate oxidase
MGKVYPELDERLRKFIASQPVFFVATAPCWPARGADTDGDGRLDGEGGHVNVSPKGYRDTFAVLGPTTVAYLDLTGSGAETIAHLRQNGKITIMFCSFDSAPKILRLYGTGRVVLPGDAEFSELATHFPAAHADDSPAHANGASDRVSGNGASGHVSTSVSTGVSTGDCPASHRAIVVVDVDRIADSCGYAVPVMELKQERDLLVRWAGKKTAGELSAYRAEKNLVSIDGLPALDAD